MNQKNRKILPSEVDHVTLFLRFQKQHLIYVRSYFTFCALTLEPFVVTI